MQFVRHLIAQRHLALLICAAALLLKLIVPTGYMIAHDHGRLSVVVCSGLAPVATTMEMSGMHGDMPGHGKPADHGKAEMPCAFAGLSAATLAAVDPIQLAALVAFVIAAGIWPIDRSAPSRRVFLRPPPIGPPAHR